MSISRICFALTAFLGAFSVSAALIPDNDDLFLDMVQHRTFNYFLECVNMENGLVMDRTGNFGKPDFDSSPATVAGTGFFLSSLIVGIDRGWIDRTEAERITLNTLRFFWEDFRNEHGFFYHFVDMKSGERVWTCEISSIDTALFLAGALHAAEYYGSGEIRDLADSIYRRVDWQWMTNGKNILCMGWRPEKGFISSYWNMYCESLIMYLMAIGSPTHPIPPTCWDGFARLVEKYGEFELISSPPLFTHQYSHVWVDFKNIHDKYADYFTNSVKATLANRRYCLDNSGTFHTFNENCWGLTACLGPDGYTAYGAPPGVAVCDGTVAPAAAGGSIVFTPAESIKVLRNILSSQSEKMWGRFGFTDSFNLDRNWFADYAYAINQGPILLMIENYRTGLIWHDFMKCAYITQAMQKVGFKPGKSGFLSQSLTRTHSKVYSREKRPELTTHSFRGQDFLNFDSPEWNSQGIAHFRLTQADLESGSLSHPDCYCDAKIAYTDKQLLIRVRVRDQELVSVHDTEEMQFDDCLEIFLDTEDNGLTWCGPKDFQIIVSPDQTLTDLRVRDFFHQVQLNITKAYRKSADGYEAILAIPRTETQMQENGIALTIGFHNLDKNSEGKMNWFFPRPCTLLGRINFQTEAIK
ncbi:MAG: glucoamylase family protein [Candidatus Wallbacteria bacterium]|nr:glucoamylase family protein [Candidatus Wallbacteria bacterium]